MFIPSPRTPSSPTSTGVTTVILVQRSECVPKKRGSSPVVAIQWETSRAYCRVVAADLDRDGCRRGIRPGFY